MTEGNRRTELEQLGEFGLIERIRNRFAQTRPDTRVGIGDDAAVIESGGILKLISTDMLTESIHFDLTYAPLTHLGYKAVAVNISDIAAMNGLAQHILVSIGLSNRFSIEAVDALYEGINYACEDFNVDLIGGDTTSSRAGLVISVTALGEVEKDKLSLRSGAKVNDIICVTGDLGGAYMGLQVLEREKQVFMANPEMQPQLQNYDQIVGRQLRPKARTDIVFELRDFGVVPTAMIDVSDGLASEVLHISNSSGVGIQLFEDKLPITKMAMDTAVEFNLSPTTAIMNGGEDYELLFTIDQNDYPKIKHHPDIHFIGYVQEKSLGNTLVTKGGQTAEIKAQGWKHFG